MAIQANLRGIDLNKQTTKRDADGNLVRPIEGIPIPESQGTIAAAVPRFGFEHDLFFSVTPVEYTPRS